MYSFPSFDLHGKVAIVTGAGQGLGKWIALGLAQFGADVVVADLMKEGATETSGEIKAMGRKSIPYPINVTDVEAVRGMIDATVKHFGRLDILVNNAGVNVHKKAIEFTEEEFLRVVNVNAKGVYFCSQAAAGHMIPQGSGKIINIASSAAFLVRAGIPNSVYAMTKGGVVMLTKAMAEEWAQYHVNVNAVAPGYFATPLVADRLTDKEAYQTIIESTPLKRVGGPEDIMGVIVFLASGASDYITGQTICVDGGRTVL
jgi:2-dehydro-3-deoxy-D-gluconate 5-dehydrogenase